MNSPKTSAVNPAHGLSLLMMHEKCLYFKHLDDCHGYTHQHQGHPFGLDLPPQEAWRHIQPQVNFVGANATDVSVEVFLAHVRFWAGYTEDGKITKLRVISMPFAGGARGQNHVFFEMWTPSQVTISGETTDFSGAGGAARRELEDVFAVLSQVYGVEIERVQLNKIIRIQDLYAEKVS